MVERSRGIASEDVLFVIEPDAEFSMPVGRGLPIPSLHVLGQTPPQDFAAFSSIFVDVSLGTRANVLALRELLADAPRSVPRCFLVHSGRRADLVQANVLGATRVEARPLDDKRYGQILAEFRHRPATRPVDAVATAMAAADALDASFGALASGHPLAAASFDESAGQIGEAIGQEGLSTWLDMVRLHHKGTFQHCLLVTGVLTSFGQALGFSQSDVKLLTSAGLLHDIGKAGISIDILEKPGQLSPAERREIERHPTIGYTYLAGQFGIATSVMNAVRDHHEYLDGSGYPNGIGASDIDDLTRIVTICDIYGALSERRAYKPPMAPTECLRILATMADQGKLEAALVKAFRQTIKAGPAREPGLSARSA